jgi:hypothetical protein
MSNTTYDLSKMSKGDLSSPYSLYSSAPAVQSAASPAAAASPASSAMKSNAWVVDPYGVSRPGWINPATNLTHYSPDFSAGSRIHVGDRVDSQFGSWVLGADGKGYAPQTGAGIIKNGRKEYMDAMERYLAMLNEGTSARLRRSVDSVNSQKKYIEDRLNTDLRSAYVQHMMNQKDINQNLAAMGITGGAAESSAVSMASNYANNTNSLRKNAENERYELENRILDLENQADIERAQNDMAYRDKLLNYLTYNSEREENNFKYDTELYRENARYADEQLDKKKAEYEKFGKLANRNDYMAAIIRNLSDGDPTNDWKADRDAAWRAEKVYEDEQLAAQLSEKYGDGDAYLDLLFSDNPLVREYFSKNPDLSSKITQGVTDNYDRYVMAAEQQLAIGDNTVKEGQLANEWYPKVQGANVNSANAGTDLTRAQIDALRQDTSQSAGLYPLKYAAAQAELSGGGSKASAEKATLSASGVEDTVKRMIDKYTRDGQGHPMEEGEYQNGWKEAFAKDVFAAGYNTLDAYNILIKAGLSPTEIEQYANNFSGG